MIKNESITIWINHIQRLKIIVAGMVGYWTHSFGGQKLSGLYNQSLHLHSDHVHIFFV